MAYTKTEKDVKLCLSFINILEGAKSMCKALHWGASNLSVKDKRGAHIYLDDFLEVIGDFQDTLAECSQGILGTYLGVDNVKGEQLKGIKTPNNLVDNLIENTSFFYNTLPKDIIFVGIKSETENFIKELNKYKYLFSLI